MCYNFRYHLRLEKNWKVCYGFVLIPYSVAALGDMHAYFCSTCLTRPAPALEEVWDTVGYVGY